MQLKSINDLKCSLLTTCEEINQFTKGKERMTYISEMKSELEAVKRLNEYNKDQISQWNENYRKISFWLRLFSGVPYAERIISNKLMILAVPQESDFITTSITFPKIENIYAQKISDTNKEIKRLSELIILAEKYSVAIESVVIPLHKNNCNIPLLRNEIRCDN